MLSPKKTYEFLLNAGFEFFTGVPDSLLKDFISYISDITEKSNHVIAANEGNAIALAAGYYLGKGLPAFVYMQNSGIGNAINPLISLADRKVYSIPMMLMIGWRGEPGVKDEPQHITQGRVMIKLLDSIEIPWFILDAKSDLESVLSKAIDKMNRNSSPVALLVKKDTFEQYLKPRANNNYLMTREQAIHLIVDTLDKKDAFISTTGMTSRELYEYRISKGESLNNDFLTVGGMGHASSIAMGLSLAKKNRRIVCIDGDGSVIMHLGSMALIGQSEISNLVHIVINNGSHDSVGGQPTIGFLINLTSIAKACGYKKIESVSNPKDLTEFLISITNFNGPVFLEILVRKGFRVNLGRPTTLPVENKIGFMNGMLN